ncbi:MAG: hypothetical protein ACYSU0_07930 [Planctomycetota bacterium]
MGLPSLIGVIAVPAVQARPVGKLFARYRVRTILNLAPAALWPGEDAAVRNVHFAIEFERFCCSPMARRAGVS